MLACMEEHFPKVLPGHSRRVVSLSGFLSGRSYSPSDLLKAVERKVAFVDGDGFFVNDNGKHTARFSFPRLHRKR